MLITRIMGGYRPLRVHFKALIHHYVRDNNHSWSSVWNEYLPWI